MANQTQRLRVIWLRKDIAFYGLAMPFSLGDLCMCGGSNVFASLIFTGAQGLSVPSSGGSPPTSD